MAIGNIDSCDAGSGARFNDGKLQMGLVPVRIWLDYWQANFDWKTLVDLYDILEELARFQEGEDDSAQKALNVASSELMEQTVGVLVFGAKKYKEWNWAKGMPWQVPIECCLRHARKIIEQDEDIDEESGLPHMAHICCNLVMLAWFVRYYPDGDNRPPIN